MPAITSSVPAGRDFEEHGADVYGWAYRILGRHHDALDVVQDVFVQWHRQCRHEPPAQPRGWLRRVTVNRAIDLRRRQRSSGFAAAGGTSEGYGQPEEGGDPLDHAVLRDDIAAALDGLTELQRGVLIAKVYDEMTFSAIAVELSLAVSTVKTHYLRAIRSVRDCLQGRWG